MDHNTPANGKTHTLPGEWAARVGLIIFSLLLTCILLELALNFAAMFVDSRPVSVSAGRGTILTLGDSHTYGVKTQPEESYPGQLQTLLDTRAPGRYNVVNLGVPGTNSAEIAARLPGWIDRYRPFAVIVCVGINNRWNYSDTQEVERLGKIGQWFADLRLVRLYHLLRLNLQSAFSTPERLERPELLRTQVDGEEAGVEFRDARTGEIVMRHEGVPDKQSYNKPALRRLRRDLEHIRLVAEQRNVQLILLAYSAFSLPDNPGWGIPTIMSQELREFSKLHGLPLVDPRDRFLELLSGDVPRSQYFLSDLDDHPNPAGYAEIAALVADVFESR